MYDPTPFHGAGNRPRARLSPAFLLVLAVTLSGGALCVVTQPLALTAGVVLLVLGGWAASLCLHEFGHAAVAYRGGDRSVVAKGYLTLDIRRYTEPGLSFVLPLVFLLLGGVPLPGGAVWINQSAIPSRAARSLVSLAGPSVNLLLGVLLVALTATVALPAGLLVGLSYLALLQLLAFLLNVLPVPGLDGFGIVEPHLPPAAQMTAARVRPWAPLALFVLLLGVPAANAAFFDTGQALFTAVGGNPYAAARGYSEFVFWQR